jgi:hypothetical protein
MTKEAWLAQMYIGPPMKVSLVSMTSVNFGLSLISRNEFTVLSDGKLMVARFVLLLTERYPFADDNSVDESTFTLDSATLRWPLMTLQPERS